MIISLPCSGDDWQPRSRVLRSGTRCVYLFIPMYVSTSNLYRFTPYCTVSPPLCTYSSPSCTYSCPSFKGTSVVDPELFEGSGSGINSFGSGSGQFGTVPYLFTFILQLIHLRTCTYLALYSKQYLLPSPSVPDP